MIKNPIISKNCVFKIFFFLFVYTVLIIILKYMKEFGIIRESYDYLCNSIEGLITLMLCIYLLNYNMYKCIINKIKITKVQLHTIAIPILLALIQRFIVDTLQIAPEFFGKERLTPGKGQLVFDSPTLFEDILSGLIVAPFIEELLFRVIFFMIITYVLKSIVKNKDVSENILNLNNIYCWILIFINNILFSFTHIPDRNTFYIYFIGGVVDTVIYIKYGFFSSFLCHGVFNLTSSTSILKFLGL